MLSLDLENVKGFRYNSNDEEVILDRPVYRILFSEYKYEISENIYYIPVIFYKTSNVPKIKRIQNMMSSYW